MKEKIVEVEINSIQPNTWNPNVVSEEDMAKLRHSIELGYFQPLVLWKKEEGYVIIDGEHRWKILKEKGYNKVEALVLTDDDLLSLAEKLQLPIEEPSEVAKSLTYLLNKARGDIDVVMLAEMVSSMNFAKELMKLSDQEMEILQVINRVPKNEMEVIEKNLQQEEAKPIMLRVKLTHQEYEEWQELRKKLDMDDRKLLTYLINFYKHHNAEE